MSVPSSLNSSKESLLSNLKRLELEKKILKAKTEELELCVLQTLKNQNSGRAGSSIIEHTDLQIAP